MKLATTARVPQWKIEPHHKTYERLTYIVNDRPRYHNYQVIPPPPPPQNYNYTPPPPLPPPLISNYTPPPPPR
ncbi:hypothetical protein TSUD_118860 [Trifolium subterraneum]|uniref:Uncharacterized protein n=1 Tax=Trifolium subterraneum TaxID=3900 RepID=A0A2Z6N9B6_TRISU|nr:hypothetical protein TSUD_118860 [Trifolium subterraneum]